MRILSLTDNLTASPKLFSEHGFSIYIEQNKQKFLFGTGASDKFLKNAERMQIDLSDIKAAALPHNHTSCASGTEDLIKFKPDVKIFAKKEICNDYFVKAGIFKLPTGLSREFIENHLQNFVLFNKFSQIAKGIFLVSNETAEINIADDKSFYAAFENKTVYDDFSQEIFAAAFPTGEIADGCVIITCCSHMGIANIIATVRYNWGNIPILGIVGGLHLTSRSAKTPLINAEKAEQIAKEIKRFNIGQIYTCHCTGKHGYKLLKEYLGDQLQYLRAGEELEFN
jgi:7,8-dihydropterin-6-yl-methyl-4-(beta-D-ribofuranosyl)aminobenzene 5'-phosphate synthase